MSNPPFTVRAVFEYSSGHDDDLSFPIGQIVTVTAVEDAEWYYGEYTDGAGAKQEGIFPKNFVEKYEPPAPPRPARPNRSKKEPEPAPVEPSAPVSESQPQEEPEPAESPAADEHDTASQPIASPQSPPLASSPPPAEIPSSPPQPAQAPVPGSAPVPAAAAAPPPVKASSKPPPPAVAEKPTGNSFKDRIAAFNKSTAAPIAPFKPEGQKTNTFIKKQFVAPPPSKDSFVPPPREPVPKVYKREEDPEVQEQVAREPPVSEHRPPPAPPAPETEEGAEEQPKPTSLKDRIALLQKQQMEQAQRHADAAQKKEKPKPPKKPVEQPAEPVAAEEELESPPIESPGTARDPSVDTLRSKAPPAVPTPFSPSEEVASESNDADYSAAADSEDAGETSTSKDDEEEPSRHPSTHQAEQTGEEADEEETEEEEMDPETKRRMELRNRMAKMSGGMGMVGLFGPPGGLPGMAPSGGRKPKTPGESEKKLAQPDTDPTSPAAAPPVPMIPLPGMNVNSKPAAPVDVEKEDEEHVSTPVTEQHPPREVPDVEEVVHEGAPPRRSTDRPPPVPPTQERTAPAPPPPSSRPVPPPPAPVEQPTSPPPVPGGRPAAPLKHSDEGSESDDELSVHARNLSLSSPTQPAVAVPEVPAPAIPDNLDSRRPSTHDDLPTGPSASTADKRASRPPPPIPSNPPMPAQGRAPPPPPPNQPRRRSTADSRGSVPRQAGEDPEGEVTEYDGDYDTDIASGAKHKDALRAHERDSSFDEGTITDDHSIQSPRSPRESRPPPPIPTAAVPRGVPPPPPSQPPRTTRASVDTPRGPPPPPPAKESSRGGDDEYDPFNYVAPQHGLPTAPPPPSGRPEAPPPPLPQTLTQTYDDLYDASPVQSPANESQPTPQHEKRPSLAPPLPPSQPPAMPSPSLGRGQRSSMDVVRQPNVRRSMDVSRPSVDQGFIATEVDLAETSLWWTQPNTPPPALQGRKDILFEIEESSSSKRGGKTTVSKDIYVLFMDYSQTVVTVQFDAKNAEDANLEQRQESPPLQPRQDQLEEAHTQLGTRISESVTSVQNSTVGDGTPFGLVQYLLNPLAEALLPVGTRAYGALVYSNLANASVSQNDEIRAGDIVSFRNARFQGHRGTMHQKYSAEVGKPDHVGIVVDWDGTKKKIRAWEQGRESKKVKMESFKLGDLRSGECKVWRVMPRSWVGWEGSK